MAEVVEINLVCANNLDIKMLIDFIHGNSNICMGTMSIEAMDNWEYDNSINISYEEIEEYLDKNKIINITEKTDDGFIGLDIERFGSKICYRIWFNEIKYEKICEYNNLLSVFLVCLKDKMKNKPELFTALP